MASRHRIATDGSVCPMLGYVFIGVLVVSFGWVALQIFRDDGKNKNG
jgi:hypothetical protein